MEVSYKEYMEHLYDEKVQYHRQFIVPSDLKTPEEIYEFVQENLENYNNTDINKYYKSIGIISNSETEKEEQKVNNLATNN